MNNPVDDSLTPTVAALTRTESISFRDWKPGDVIANGLEIKELIGQGGMGVVWRVHHREWNRELAVKMPLPSLVGSPTARERFLREAETWIDLGVHPHIVQCWFVKDISGLPSLFLDYLTGGSLKQWLTAGHIKPGQWQRILEIAIQVAEGLAYAHSRGVVHRDVKPANLLIRGDERVCVTDFGIVKTLNDTTANEVAVDLNDLPEDLSITSTGAFLGTPQYGAPEQWGAAEGVDHSADIYALGVTLYEMLCGRRPFDTDDEDTPPEVLISAHLNTPAPDPREFYPDVPPELAHLTLLCLEKDRRRRPHDMERLKQALEGIYERLFSEPYRGVGNVPKEQRADTLNNRGVSLHSLAKPREARDVWRRGLRIESGHAECLYNLTQLELRAGRIDSGEALRRLRQAKAGLPLALMCIEEGLHNEAIETLQSLNSSETDLYRGQIQRALGDAQMYAKQFYGAEAAYRSALAAMPADTLSQERKKLANLGRRGLHERILFPSTEPVFNVVFNDETMLVICEDKSRAIVGVSESSIVYWNIADQSVETRVSRPEGSTRPVSIRTAHNLLLFEDETSFELRRLPTLELVGRKTGRIRTTTRNLRKLLIEEPRGLFVFNIPESKLQKLSVDTTQAARFDHTGELLCLLLDDGRIAQIAENGDVVPEEWPPPLERYDEKSCLALSACGTRLYIGHTCGRLQAFDFTTQEIAFEMTLGEPVEKIYTTPVTRKIVVRLRTKFVLLERSGEIILQGTGPITVDRKNGHALCFHRGRLELYSLSPYRRLRVWQEHKEGASRVYLAADGQRAVTQNSSGQFSVWEVDESNRVFERGLLLSPGKSFADILSASKRFRESMDLANEALRRDQLASSYRHLQRARSVNGYAQRPEALNLNWRLLSVLRRDQLESVWERASIESRGRSTTPGPAALLGMGERLLVSFNRQVQLYRDDGNQVDLAWSESLPARIRAIHVSDESSAEVLDDEGHGWKFDVESGEHSQIFNLKVGRLENILSNDNGVYFSDENGLIGFYDRRSRKVTNRYEGMSGRRFKIFDWQPYCLLVVAESELFTLNFQNRKPQLSKLHLDRPAVQSQARVTYASHSEDGRVCYLGFGDGRFELCDPTGTPLFYLQAANGAITDFHPIPSLSVGVGTTANGKLIFWDLHTGDRLEEFSAHRGPIVSLDPDSSGRFLLTAGNDDQVRLWETSWTALEEVGELPPNWLPPQTPTGLKRLFGFGRR